MLETILTMIAVIISLYFIYSQLSKLNNRINILEEAVFKIVNNNIKETTTDSLSEKQPTNAQNIPNNPLFNMLSGGLPDFLNISPPTNSVEETCNLQNENDTNSELDINDNSEEDEHSDEDEKDDANDSEDNANDSEEDGDNQDSDSNDDVDENIDEDKNEEKDADESTQEDEDKYSSEIEHNSNKLSNMNLQHTLDLISNNLTGNESSCLEPCESEELTNISKQKKSRGRRKKIVME